MKIERTKNASRNVAFGMFLKLYQIVVPFILRTVMIRIMGMEYVGLNSLFTSILQVLNMTELGVGTAMVFSMYKPIAEDDANKICALMNLYKTYYRIIGILIAIIGFAITPLVPHLVKSDTPIPLNITYLYWINLGYTVLSYWLFAYKNSVLQAHQRTDVISKVTLFTNIITHIFQLFILFILKDYYIYLIILLLGQALNNISTAIVASHLYPQYKAQGKLNDSEIKEINQRVKALFTSKVGGVIQNSADSIVISTFLGIVILGQYNNYYYILNAVFGFVSLIFTACLAGVGNSIVLDSIDKIYVDFKKISLLVEWIACFTSCCLLCLYQPFIEIWAKEENVLPFGIAICLSIYLYIIITNQLLCLYKDAAGIWQSDKFRPLITALINFLLNIISVKFIGLYGVVLSTVLSMLIVGIPWLTKNLFQTVFHRSPKEYIKKLLSYCFTSVIACCLSLLLCSSFTLNLYLTLLIRLIICLIVPNIIFFVVYRKTEEFSLLLKLINNITHGFIAKIPGFRKLISR